MCLDVIWTSRTLNTGLMLRKCIKKQVLCCYPYCCHLLTWKNIRRQTIVTLMSIQNVRSFCVEKLAIQCAVVGGMLVPQMLRDPHTYLFQILRISSRNDCGSCVSSSSSRVVVVVVVVVVVAVVVEEVVVAVVEIVVVSVASDRDFFEVFLGAFLSNTGRPCYVIYPKPTQPPSLNNVCYENQLKNVLLKAFFYRPCKGRQAFQNLSNDLLEAF